MIQIASKNTGASVRTLGECFQCGRTQIASILREKASILALYKANASGDSFHTWKRSCNSKYADINEALYKWYLLACSKNIYPGGAQLVEKAKDIAAHLGKSEFKVRIDG